MTTPDDCHIRAALAAATLSPCRSKRGVVLFDPGTGAHCGYGHNGPPAAQPCPGREICAGTCGQRSVHAEVRALREAAWHRQRFNVTAVLDLVHVELSSTGGVIACSGPSCWQCAREILDVGFVGGVWLYEEPVRRCLACRRFEDSSASIKDRWRRCCECGAALTPIVAWRRYTAAEFYVCTLRNCGMVAP